MHPPTEDQLDLTQAHRIDGYTWRPDPEAATPNTAKQGALVCVLALADHGAIQGMITYDRQAITVKTHVMAWLGHLTTGHVVLFSGKFIEELPLDQAHAYLIRHTRRVLEALALNLK
jgi:hypothetical protein